MNGRHVVVVGGGAAGFFAAITCAQLAPGVKITLLEKGPQFLSKVRISGGGRCNVTHACFDARELSTRYPRGERALIGPFQRFQARDTVEWFEARGVKLKVETDGRMFPVTDSSQTIIDCLIREARATGVTLMPRTGVLDARGRPQGGFELRLSSGSEPRNEPKKVSDSEGEKGELVETSPVMECDRLLLATGGCRTPSAGQVAVSLGHTLEPPVPSLFTFHIESRWLPGLAGVAVEPVEAFVPGTGLRERGALLITHWGVSGPAILRLSAWGARALHARGYRFPLIVNWLPHLDHEGLSRELLARRNSQPARLVVNSPIPPLSARLWERLVIASGISRETRWSALSRSAHHKVVQQLLRTEFNVRDKSLNKEEFVTCGGVPLSEVDFKTMQSRICPGLYFAGELLDIDGITGGFNFQSAWTTGWIAGNAIASELNR